MKLSKYDIIKGPVISDKAYKLNQTQKKLVLKVHPSANKPLIKDAIEALFNVKVKDVRTLIRKKTEGSVASRRHNATPKITKNKIAYVTLVEGYSLNLFDQGGKAPLEVSKKSE